MAFIPRLLFKEEKVGVYKLTSDEEVNMDIECDVDIQDLEGLNKIISDYGKLEKVEKGSIVITIGIGSAGQLTKLIYEYREGILRAKMQAWLESEQKQKVEDVLVTIKDKILWELDEFYKKEAVPCSILIAYCPVTWRWFWTPENDATWWQHCTSLVLTDGPLADCRPRDDDVNILLELARWNGEKEIVTNPHPCIFCKQRREHPTKSKGPPNPENFSLKVEVTWEELSCNFQVDSDEEQEKETGDMLADMLSHRPVADTMAKKNKYLNTFT